MGKRIAVIVVLVVGLVGLEIGLGDNGPIESVGRYGSTRAELMNSSKMLENIKLDMERLVEENGEQEIADVYEVVTGSPWVVSVESVVIVNISGNETVLIKNVTDVQT
jgi:hypothetical protein